MQNNPKEHASAGWLDRMVHSIPYDSVKQPPTFQVEGSEAKEVLHHLPTQAAENTEHPRAEGKLSVAVLRIEASGTGRIQDTSIGPKVLPGQPTCKCQVLYLMVKVS